MKSAALQGFLFATAAAFPGSDHLHPKIHNTPSYVSDRGGWHDIAGAITHNGIHHIYQGTGWNHAQSNDLVHWFAGEHGPSAIHETYMGMDSDTDPCSGYLVKDDDGVVCAGFRQCGSSKGVQGMESWDVPLELRCATDQTNLSSFTADPTSDLFDYIYNVSFWRAIPYDPARPWKDDTSGMWYQLLSMDACNSTDAPRNVGGKTCSLGGQLVMWQSPALRGPKAKWELVGPVWTDNTTVLKDGFLSHEFVTIDFLGTMSGDPDPEKKTLVFLNNVGGNGGGDGCCSGTASYTILKQPDGPGTPFVEFGPGQQMIDWGSFTPKPSPPSGAHGVDLLTGTASRGLSMARTLGSEEADQVTKPGRRVLIGWTGPADGKVFGGQGSAQGLARDLTMGSDFEILQAFVPELEMLRQKHTTGSCNAGLQAEVLAHFGPECANSKCGLQLLGDGQNATIVTLSADLGLVLVDATAQGNTAVRAGPLPNANAKGGWTVHAIVDHSIVELIVNNRTALVVYAAPTSDTSGRVELFGACETASLDVWELSSAQQAQ